MTTRMVAAYLRGRMAAHSPTPLEEDFINPPAGTRNYEGRVYAFHVTTPDGRELRITVEDVTLEEDT